MNAIPSNTFFTPNLISKLVQMNVIRLNQDDDSSGLGLYFS